MQNRSLHTDLHTKNTIQDRALYLILRITIRFQKACKQATF